MKDEMHHSLDEFENQFSSVESVNEGTEFIDNHLWYKLEKFGKKISFIKDIQALYRYLKDKSVPWYRKSIIVGALIYFISPIDAVPDLAPLIGYLDDLGVITAVLKFMGSEIIPYYKES